MDPELFAEVPEDVTQLTDEQLDELIADHEQGIVRVATGEAFASMEAPPGRNERRDMLAAARDNLLRLRAEKADRVVESEDFDAEVAQIAAEAGVALEEPAADPEPDEPAAVELAAEDEPAPDDPSDPEPEDPEAADTADEPVTAGAARREYSRPPAAPRRNQPLTVGPDGPVLRASAGLERIREGDPLDREALAKITIEKARRFVATPPGFSEKVVVASANWADQYDDSRVLEGDHSAFSVANMDKIRAVRGPEALAASGGWCAPSTIRYDIGTLGTTARPVRDALTAFLATRGGLQYLPDMSIAATDTTDGTSNITEAQDESGGSPALKTCTTIDCPTFTDARADILATCLEAGNLMQIAFPELVAAWQDLLNVQAARERETNLLDAIVADPQTKRVTSPQLYGAWFSIVYPALRLASSYRSRHRLDQGAVLRALAPAWLADLLVADALAREFPLMGGDVTRDSVAAKLRQLTSIDFTWILDGATGASQVAGNEVDGSAIDAFPNTFAEIYVYPEGGVLLIDQGELNIGLVRDSALNETNDVRFFAEVFEQAAVIAAEAFEWEATVCPTGAAAPLASALISCP